MLHRKMAIFLVLSALLGGFTGCTQNKVELGKKENPIKFFFVPSVDVKVLEDTSKIIKNYLEENTPYHFQVSIPASYVAVVEAFGTKRADIAALNTFGYMLAHKKYGAEARLTVMRHGSSTYRSQIIARADSGINSLEDLKGKKFAFVDPASTSGYLLPLKLMNDSGVKPKETVYAKRHDSVVSMIYQNQVEAGATFYSPPEDGEIQDARRLVKTQYPDVEEKIKIVKLTDPIPNDPVVFRKEMSDKMKQTIEDTLVEYIHTKEGKDAFKKLYGATDFKRASDKDYKSVRDLLKSLNKSAKELVQNK